MKSWGFAAGPAWLALVAFLLSPTPEAVRAADGTWTATAHGYWPDAPNWLGGVVADGAGSTATFSADVPGAGIFITNWPPRTIGNLVFRDTDPSSAGSWMVTNGNLTLQSTAPTITVEPLGAGAAARIRSELYGTQGLTKAGDGMLILTSQNDYGATTTVERGILQIGHNEYSVFVGAAGHHYTVAGGAQLGFDRNRNQADFTTQSIHGEGDVYFRGQQDGTYRFLPGYSGTLDYTGKTIVDLDTGSTWDKGTLWLEKDDVLPHASLLDLQRGKVYLRNQTGSGLTVAGLTGKPGAFLVPREGAGLQKLTLDVAEGESHTYAGHLGADGSAGGGDNLTLAKTGPGTQVLTSANTYSGGTNVFAGTLQIGSGEASPALGAGGFYVAEGASLVFHRNFMPTDFTDQSIGGAGEVAFRGQAGGYYRFLAAYSGTLDYTGKTTIDLDPGGEWYHGSLWLEKDDVLPHATVVDIQRGKAYLRNQTGSGLTIGGLEGNTGTFLVPRDGAGLQKVTIDVAAGRVHTYFGTLGSDGSTGGGTNLALTKRGPGTQVLAGANDYSGGTTIAGGTLAIDGSLAAGSPVQVQSGAALGGTGSIGGPVSILAGGALAPGTGEDGGVGTLRLDGDLAFEEGAFFDIDIAAPGVADLVQMSGGTLSPGNAAIRVRLLDDFNPEPYTSWTILTGEEAVAGEKFRPEIVIDGPKFLAEGKWLEVSYLASVTLTVVAVPEPAAWTLLLCGLASGLLVRRRRRPPGM